MIVEKISELQLVFQGIAKAKSGERDPFLVG